MARLIVFIFTLTLFALPLRSGLGRLHPDHAAVLFNLTKRVGLNLRRKTGFEMP